MSKLTKLSAILLGQDITNEESVAQSREVSCGTTDENLTHSRCQVGDCGLVVSHPFGEDFIGDGIRRGDDNLGTKE